MVKQRKYKSTLDNSPPPLLNLSELFIYFFQPLSNLSENCLFVTFITNLSSINTKLFVLSRPQGEIIDAKCTESQKIGYFAFFSAIIEPVWELVICNTDNKFGEDTWTNFQVIVPTSKW